MWRAEKNYYNKTVEIIFEHAGWDIQVVGADTTVQNKTFMGYDEDGLYMYAYTYGPTKKRRTGRMWLTFPRSFNEVY